MSRRNSTRERNGSTERRCAHPKHEGARWLPLGSAHFYFTSKEGVAVFGHYCKACHRRHMRETWRKANPGFKPRAERGLPRARTPSAYDLLDMATRRWVRA